MNKSLSVAAVFEKTSRGAFGVTVPIPTLPSDAMRTFSAGAPFAAFPTLNVNAASSVATLAVHLSLPLPLV